MSPFVCNFGIPTSAESRKCVVTRQYQRPVNGIFNWRFLASSSLNCKSKWLAGLSTTLIQVWHFKAGNRNLLSCDFFVVHPSSFFLHEEKKLFTRQKCSCNDSWKPHTLTSSRFDCRFCPICDGIKSIFRAILRLNKSAIIAFLRNESESLFLQSNCFSNFEIIFFASFRNFYHRRRQQQQRNQMNSAATRL